MIYFKMKLLKPLHEFNNMPKIIIQNIMNVTNPNKNEIEWSFLSISSILTINANPKKKEKKENTINPKRVLSSGFSYHERLIRNHP